MAEPDASETASETEAPAQEQQQPAEPEKPRQEVPSEVASALRKANKEAETLRRQLKEYQDKDKTEAERLAERATEAERRATEAEAQLLRRDVALAKGLPAAFVGRLQGSTKDELEADADTLLAALKPAEGDGKPSFPDLGQGRRSGTPKPSVELGRQMFEARHPTKT